MGKIVICSYDNHPKNLSYRYENILASDECNDEVA
ncbi:MAG: hypothetical protein KatS3mg054_1490 [Chloroflexus sp.]|jgi:hypothetical protein|nr:MAG: hypothetical protein KatS3mg054_1490 [Chloroflexus sp.]